MPTELEATFIASHLIVHMNSTRVRFLYDYEVVAMHYAVKALLPEGSADLRPAQMLSSMRHRVYGIYYRWVRTRFKAK